VLPLALIVAAPIGVRVPVTAVASLGLLSLVGSVARGGWRPVATGGGGPAQMQLTQ
jgi:hypothetical protein